MSVDKKRSRLHAPILTTYRVFWLDFGFWGSGFGFRVSGSGSDLLFGLPVVMDTHSHTVKEGDRIALHFQGEVVAVMEVNSKWAPNKAKEALQSYKYIIPPFPPSPRSNRHEFWIGNEKYM